jgi:aminopeptidase YwaD
MDSHKLTGMAANILHFLCEELHTRRVGSEENRKATSFFAEKIAASGFSVQTPRFTCMDWEEQGASLMVNGTPFDVLPSPYTIGFSGQGELVIASTVSELENLDMHDKILLLRGEVTTSQLFPKNFRFYNPEEHQHIYRLLEAGAPKAIITATGKNPDLAGAMYPFPMFEDGDFEIPSVYMKDADGERLVKLRGQIAQLECHSQRIPTFGYNVVATKQGRQRSRIVVSAHIDAKPGTPGALDNAAGITALLLLGELLHDYNANFDLEIVVFNGEDYYASSGEILYMDSNAQKIQEIALVINMDGVGLKDCPTAFSLYGCSREVEEKARSAFLSCGMVEGEAWYQSDHTMFIQLGRPAIALTTQDFGQFTSKIIHTPNDIIDNVNPQELVNIAGCLASLIQSL